MAGFRSGLVTGAAVGMAGLAALAALTEPATPPGQGVAVRMPADAPAAMPAGMSADAPADTPPAVPADTSADTPRPAGSPPPGTQPQPAPGDASEAGMPSPADGAAAPTPSGATASAPGAGGARGAQPAMAPPASSPPDAAIEESAASRVGSGPAPGAAPEDAGATAEAAFLPEPPVPMITPPAGLSPRLLPMTPPSLPQPVEADADTPPPTPAQPPAPAPPEPAPPSHPVLAAPTPSAFDIAATEPAQTGDEAPAAEGEGDAGGPVTPAIADPAPHPQADAHRPPTPARADEAGTDRTIAQASPAQEPETSLAEAPEPPGTGSEHGADGEFRGSGVGSDPVAGMEVDAADPSHAVLAEAIDGDAPELGAGSDAAGVAADLPGGALDADGDGDLWEAGIDSDPIAGVEADAADPSQAVLSETVAGDEPELGAGSDAAGIAADPPGSSLDADGGGEFRGSGVGSDRVAGMEVDAADASHAVLAEAVDGGAPELGAGFDAAGVAAEPPGSSLDADGDGEFRESGAGNDPIAVMEVDAADSSHVTLAEAVYGDASELIADSDAAGVAAEPPGSSFDADGDGDLRGSGAGSDPIAGVDAEAADSPHAALAETVDGGAPELGAGSDAAGIAADPPGSSLDADGDEGLRETAAGSDPVAAMEADAAASSASAFSDAADGDSLEPGTDSDTADAAGQPGPGGGGRASTMPPGGVGSAAGLARHPRYPAPDLTIPSSTADLFNQHPGGTN